MHHEINTNPAQHPAPRHGMHPLPPHLMHQHAHFDMDTLNEALAAEGLAWAADAIAGAPVEVKFAISLLANVPLSLDELPDNVMGGFPCYPEFAFDEGIDDIAQRLGVSRDRVVQELSRAPQEMTAMVLLAQRLSASTSKEE